MNNKIPTVDFRWGDLYWITDFVTPHNPDIEQVAGGFSAGNNNGFVAQVASYIRDDFQYPFLGTMPSADGQILRYRKTIFPPRYGWRVCRYYVWAFPSEVLLSKLGYCSESTNLYVSLLRTRELDAWTALGEVRKTSTDELLGYHAWSICPYKHDTFLIETTIHEPGAANMITLHDAYHKDSDFATTSGIYYVEDARYDESQYIGTTDLGLSGMIFTLMGLSQRQLKMFGLERTMQLSAKKRYGQWRKEERLKTEEVSRAWRTI